MPHVYNPKTLSSESGGSEVSGQLNIIHVTPYPKIKIIGEKDKHHENFNLNIKAIPQITRS